MNPATGNLAPALGRRGFAAELYFDDGDDPIADTASAGLWATADEAEQAIRRDLADLAKSEPRAGVWIGYVEPGRYVASYPDDEDPLLATLMEFERDENPDPAPQPIHAEATR